jgi:hypothetical protein
MHSSYAYLSSFGTVNVAVSHAPYRRWPGKEAGFHLPRPDGGITGARGRNRTVTPLSGPGILSPVRLPVSPPGPGREVVEVNISVSGEAIFDGLPQRGNTRHVPSRLKITVRSLASLLTCNAWQFGSKEGAEFYFKVSYYTISCMFTVSAFVQNFSALLEHSRYSERVNEWRIK